VAFAGYLIAHDWHHRRQISMPARQVGHAVEGKWFWKMSFVFARLRRCVFVMMLLCVMPAHSQAPAAPAKKEVWKPVAFAIVKFNDAAPNGWNIYHSEKKGVLLVRLWKRYLLVNLRDEEAFDIDPQKLTVQGDSVEWSPADTPLRPVETPEWKERNVGQLQRVRFRLGKDGHVLELQIPLGYNGERLY